MNDSRDSSTLVALRELRSYEDNRRLEEQKKREEQARQEQRRKEEERLAKEAALRAAEEAREKALEKQLRLDLQRAQDELRRVHVQAERRVLEAVQAAKLASRNTPHPHPIPRDRRGSHVALGTAGLLAVALAIALVTRPASRATPAPLASPEQPKLICPDGARPGRESSAPEVAVKQAIAANPTVSKQLHSRLHTQSSPRPFHKPSPIKPGCDGTDPLCGLGIQSLGP